MVKKQQKTVKEWSKKRKEFAWMNLLFNESYLDCFFSFSEEPNAESEGSDHVVDSKSEILPVVEHIKHE